MLKTFSIIVTGKVQGVYYRQSTREKAVELGLTGIVQNRPDGSVHIIATGTGEQLNQLVAWCRQGPARAVVTGVQVEVKEPHGFDGFSVLR